MNVAVTSFAEGRTNLERLEAYVAAAERADPALARRNARFKSHLEHEQRKARERVAAHPQSQEAIDYNSAFAPEYG